MLDTRSEINVIKAAILGAESFGFGTAPMIALGCKYLRICHLNNCATGVATQHEGLRRTHFVGTAERVMNFFQFLAQDTREHLARLGVARLQDLIGRTDLLEQTGGQHQRQQRLNLAPLLALDNPALRGKAQYCQVERNPPFDSGELAETMLDLSRKAIAEKTGGAWHLPIQNDDRSIGAKISGEIVRAHGSRGLLDTPLHFYLTGSAGQSFGVWNTAGLHLYLKGDANDGVGKGMSGGKLVITPPEGSAFASQQAVIAGNACLYGATGGKLFMAGTAGERFAVRNSGAHAVVEGVGDHGCEYMTGGLVCVLGKTGYNFGSGMTGGMAYVLDLDNDFFDRVNPELVALERITGEDMEAWRSHLHSVLDEYVLETASQWGKTLRDNLADYLRRFWLVRPKAASLQQLLASTLGNPQ